MAGKASWIVGGLIIIGIGVWYVVGMQKAEAPDGGYAWQLTEIPEDPATPGIPRTGVVLDTNGKTYLIGEFNGSCFVIEKSEWELVEHEKSGVICWWAGGGNEIGIFEENGPSSGSGQARTVVKVGQLDEGTAEGGGMRGNFEVLLEI